MMASKRNRPKEATLVFFDYERALLSGDRRKADRLARELRAAGYFVRHLPKPGSQPPASETGAAK
jgi:hypothetical protein